MQSLSVARLFRPVARLCLLPLAAVALAACSGATGIGGAGQIDFVRVETSYSRADFAYAGAGRDSTTEIIGNPFPAVPQAEFEAAVTAAMQGAHFGPPTHFTTTPDDSAATYRVRMLWNGPVSTNGRDLCDGTAIAGGAPAEPGEARVVAAFCRSARAATYLSGAIGEVSGPDDPRFVTFVRQVTTELFPPRDGIFESDSCMWSTC